MKNNDIINVTTSENSSKIYSRKILSVIGVVLLVATFGATAGISVPDIDAGQNGFKINSGTLDVGSGDITASDGGTTIWDQSNGYIPSTQIQDSFLKNDGDTMTGNLLMDSQEINDVSIISSGSSTGATGTDDLNLGALGGGDSEITMSSNKGIAMNWDQDGGDHKFYFRESDGGMVLEGETTTDILEVDDELASGAASIHSGGAVRFDAGNDDDEDCRIENTGDIECTGSKNWIHDIGNGKEAVYTSQESPEVRAVFEGQTTVTDSKKVELPSHFSKTVSDTEPKMRAQVTPQGTFTKAVVMDKTDDYIEIKVGKETKVDYRVTGIREGYEDKQVVREKE